MFEGKKNSDGFPEWTEAEFKKAYENEWVPPTDHDDMIWVVAGTMKQASLFARQHAIYPPKWRAVENSEMIKGACGTVFYVGSFYDRQDLMAIKEEVAIGIEHGRLKVSEWDG